MTMEAWTKGDERALVRVIEPKKDRGNGTLTVNARPYGTVFIDGRKVGVTPIVKYTLPGGRHTVRVQSSVDGSTRSFHVNIEPDKAVRRNVKW